MTPTTPPPPTDPAPQTPTTGHGGPTDPTAGSVPAASPAAGQPLAEPMQDFTDCHAGIARKLELLHELPALLEPAARARQIAAQSLEFFHDVVLAHHLDEERELFPLVLQHAADGDEKVLVEAIVRRLTAEHREVERLWKTLQPGLKKVARGQDSDVNTLEIERLVVEYRSHAAYEEQEFLPLAQAILGRGAGHLAELGQAMHRRHRSLWSLMLPGRDSAAR